MTKIDYGHYGSVGDKIEVSVTVNSVKPFTLYGYSYRPTVRYLIVMTASTGHVFTTWSKGAIIDVAEPGKTLTVKATVKAHEDYRGTSQTVLTRARARDI